MNKYVLVEGVGFGGKTTLVNAVAAETDSFIVFEPGSSATLRDYIKSDPRRDSAELSLLFMADRLSIHETIKTYLSTDNVIGDRGFVSSFVYQGVLEGQLKRVVQLHNMFQDKLIYPDHIFLLDIPLHVALSRSKKRGAGPMDQHFLSDFNRIRAAYLKVAKVLNVTILDGTKSTKTLTKIVRGIAKI